MNITVEWKLEQIAKNPNKSHWRVRNFVNDIELQISNYRLTAYRLKGSNVASICSREANTLESRLKSVLL